MRILLATEDKNLRLAVQLVLSEEPGLDIVGTTGDSSSLLALYSTTCPDVVLMDFELGGVSLDSMLGEMKSSQEPAQIVVFGRDYAEKDRAIQAGADQFILKGGSPRELVESLESV